MDFLAEEQFMMNLGMYGLECTVLINFKFKLFFINLYFKAPLIEK